MRMHLNLWVTWPRHGESKLFQSHLREMYALVWERISQKRERERERERKSNTWKNLARKSPILFIHRRGDRSRFWIAYFHSLLFPSRLIFLGSSSTRLSFRFLARVRRAPRGPPRRFVAKKAEIRSPDKRLSLMNTVVVPRKCKLGVEPTRERREPPRKLRALFQKDRPGNMEAISFIIYCE